MYLRIFISDRSSILMGDYNVIETDMFHYTKRLKMNIRPLKLQ